MVDQDEIFYFSSKKDTTTVTLSSRCKGIFVLKSSSDGLGVSSVFQTAKALQPRPRLLKRVTTSF